MLIIIMKLKEVIRKYITEKIVIELLKINIKKNTSYLSLN